MMSSNNIKQLGNRTLTKTHDAIESIKQPEFSVCQRLRSTGLLGSLSRQPHDWAHPF